MTRPIDPDSLKEQVKEEFCKRRCPVRDSEPYCHPDCAARLFMGIIDNASTTDEKPLGEWKRHDEWLDVEDGYYSMGN